MPPLSFDQRDHLERYAAILWDRSHEIQCALADADPDVNAIADCSLEVLDAAQAIEVLCARVARWARHAHARA